MHISYKPLWHTLVERNMRKEDLRIAAGLTTNMIANMGKGKNISIVKDDSACERCNFAWKHRLVSKSENLNQVVRII